MKSRQAFVDAVREGKVLEMSIDPYNPAMAYDPMELDTPAGAKVRFTGYGGYEHHQEHAREYLEIGGTYTVKHIDIGDWSSTVKFEEVPGEEFNTVMFELSPASVNAIPGNVCGLCYHDKSEAGSCTRPDCEHRSINDTPLETEK